MESVSLFERIGGRVCPVAVVWHFYADVRQHQLLGPIFERQIQDWNGHIEKIADFWSLVTGGPASYGGGMPGPHIPLRLSEEHFQAWLGLFDVNCRTVGSVIAPQNSAPLPAKSANVYVSSAA